MHCPCLAAACATEWKGRSAAIGRQQGGRARIGQREGAGPPSGMYYGVSGTSVRAGQARTPFGAPEGGTYRGEGSGRAGPASRPGYLLCPRPAQAPDQSARARQRVRADGPLGLGHVADQAPPSPRSSPFPSIWVSFFPFLSSYFFFNEHTPCAS